MSSLPYYKRYTKDFLEGTVGMTGEVKGAYSVLLDLIYIQSGKLPDDPHYISGNLGYSVRKWNAIKKDLINRGKIEVKNGIISNKRADKEQIILSKYQDNQSENRSRPNKNKDLTISTVDTVYNTETETDISNKLDIKKDTKKVSRFEEFWQAFDDKRGKANALKVWKSKKLDDVAEDVISGAKIYVSQIRGEEPKYWKQAQGWLNGERWHDEPQIQTTNVIGLNANSKQAPSTGMMFLEMAKRAEEMGQ
jgi:uncharacterized protein YdaU (DUF1376 family)